MADDLNTGENGNRLAPSETGEKRRRRKPRQSANGDLDNNADTTDRERRRPRRRLETRSEDRAGTAENEAFNNEDETPAAARPRRRRRPRAAENPATDETAMPEDADGRVLSQEQLVASGSPPRRAGKKRGRRPRPRPEGEETTLEGTEGAAAATATEDDDYGLTTELQDLREDIVKSLVATDDRGDALDGGVAPGGDAATTAGRSIIGAEEPQLTSQPAASVYIERKTGFKREDKLKYEARQQMERDALDQVDHVEEVSNLTLLFGLRTQSVFRVVALLLHGAVAGFAIMHTLVVQNLWKSQTEFLTNYSQLVTGLAITFYVVLVICLVSVLDRIDIGRPTRLCFRKCITLQSIGFVSLLYLLALAMTEGMYKTNYQIKRYQDNATIWTNDPDAEFKINQWKTIDLVRTIAVVIGWFVLSISPVYDRLAENLESEIDDMMQPDQDELVEVSSGRV